MDGVAQAFLNDWSETYWPRARGRKDFFWIVRFETGARPYVDFRYPLADHHGPPLKNYDRNGCPRTRHPRLLVEGLRRNPPIRAVDATGLNRFSLYNEFGGKEGLFQATLDHYIASLGELLSLLEREPQGLANIRAFHRAQLGHDFQDGCYALNTIREKNVRAPAAAWGTIQGFTQGMRERLRRNLRRRRKLGSCRRGRSRCVGFLARRCSGLGLTHLRSLGAKPSVRRCDSSRRRGAAAGVRDSTVRIRPLRCGKSTALV